MDWGKHISNISSKATKTLGFLRRNLAFAPRSTKEVGCKTLVRPKLEYAAPIWSPYCKTQIQLVEKVQRTVARWTCRRWRDTSSVGEMLDELQWPTLEARRDQSSLLFFHKIHCGTMSIDKDKYLTPSQSTRSTRSSHNSQYCTPQTYSDALKYSFSQGLFLIGIVWLHLWSQLRPQRSSGHSYRETIYSRRYMEHLRIPREDTRDDTLTYQRDQFCRQDIDSTIHLDDSAKSFFFQNSKTLTSDNDHI